MCPWHIIVRFKVTSAVLCVREVLRTKDPLRGCLPPGLCPAYILALTLTLGRGGPASGVWGRPVCSGGPRKRRETWLGRSALGVPWGTVWAGMVGGGPVLNFAPSTSLRRLQVERDFHLRDLPIGLCLLHETQVRDASQARGVPGSDPHGRLRARAEALDEVHWD